MLVGDDASACSGVCVDNGVGTDVTVGMAVSEGIVVAVASIAGDDASPGTPANGATVSVATGVKGAKSSVEASVQLINSRNTITVSCHLCLKLLSPWLRIV